MKQSYEELMEEYEKANQASFAELNEKISALSTRLNELDPRGKLSESIKNIISIELGPKIDAISISLSTQLL